MWPFLINTELWGCKLVVSTGSLFALLAIAAGSGLYFFLLDDKQRWGSHLVFLAVAVGGGLLGARVVQFIVELFLFPERPPLLILATSGSTITGGIAGGAAAALLYRAFDREKIVGRRALDAAAVSFLAGNAVLRIGCFFYGCCYGIVDEHFPLCVTYPDDWIMRSVLNFDIPPGPRLPFPFIAAGALLLICLLLFFLYRIRLFPGLPLSLFFMLYGIYRFLSEFIRDEPSRLLIGPFSYGQWFGLVCLPVGAALLFHSIRKKPDSLQKPTALLR